MYSHQSGCDGPMEREAAVSGRNRKWGDAGDSHSPQLGGIAELNASGTFHKNRLLRAT